MGGYNRRFSARPETMPDWLAAAFADAPLSGLFVYSLLASTLLPGGSELALAGYVATQPARAVDALLLATLGNTLGALISWLCGRYLPVPRRLEAGRAADWLRRYGAAALLLSWLPLIGDLLCVAAGWLRLRFLPCLLAITTGKALRYWAVLEGVRLAGG